MALDLNKLENELDDALAKETPETLQNWLAETRNKKAIDDKIEQEINDVIYDFYKKDDKAPVKN